ncbi:MAG: hypothetical protein H0Z34_11140 [Brevibacillus sp.]|nr:hypothetical protein [Brevibacillus sp.]
MSILISNYNNWERHKHYKRIHDHNIAAKKYYCSMCSTDYWLPEKPDKCPNDDCKGRNLIDTGIKKYVEHYSSGTVTKIL